MTYVDGFILQVPVEKVDQYQAMAEKAGAIWIEHGALGVKECVMDDGTPAMPELPEDMPPFQMVSFADMARTKAGETVFFSFILFKSREHRDEVNAKVMADPRMEGLCTPDDMPFDPSRMAYGGFKAIVDL